MRLFWKIIVALIVAPPAILFFVFQWSIIYSIWSVIYTPSNPACLENNTSPEQVQALKNGATVPQRQWKTFSDPLGRFSIRFPGGYEMSGNDPKDHLQIVSHELYKTVSYSLSVDSENEKTREWIQQKKKRNNCTVYILGPTPLNSGDIGYEYVLHDRWVDVGGDYSIDKIVIVREIHKNGYVYFLEFTGTPGDKAAFQEFADSLILK